jgi:hypothetical protein
MFLALAGAFVVFVTAAAAKATFPQEIPLPTGFRPEGVAIGNGTTFYVGSIPTGAVYRGDLRTGEGAVLVPGAAGRAAIGVKVDRGLLYVAGGGTGKGFVYDARTGALVREVQLATGTSGSFVNDVVVTRRAAFFTDSQRPALYRLPLAHDGTPGTAATVVPIAGGGFTQVPNQNNLNGIDATPDGKTLVVVQTVTGKLFRVDAATGETTEIGLGGDTVVNGDGILLHGRTLYVVRNRDNQIAVVTLSASLSSGVVAPEAITDADFDVPTTIGRFGSHLYAVNAKFGTAQPTPDTAPYEVVKVDR